MASSSLGESMSPPSLALPSSFVHTTTLTISNIILFCPVLSCPVLSCPVLSCPVLSCAVLCCAVLSCAVLSCAVLCCLQNWRHVLYARYRYRRSGAYCHLEHNQRYPPPHRVFVLFLLLNLISCCLLFCFVLC